MTNFLQFAVIGLGAGACYALLAQGVVLIYRGSGVVNFAHGAFAMLAAYVTFVELRSDGPVNRFLFIPGSHFLGDSWPIVPAIVAGVVVAGRGVVPVPATGLASPAHAAPIVRVISTLGALAVVQSFVVIRYGSTTVPVADLPSGQPLQPGAASSLQEERLIVVGIAVVVTGLLWAWTRYTRVGLAISATRAERTGGADARVVARPPLGAHVDGRRHARRARRRARGAAHRAVGRDLHGRRDRRRARRRALLGGFQSFPLTLLGGLIIGVGESMATLYGGDISSFLHQDSLTGLSQAGRSS